MIKLDFNFPKMERRHARRHLAPAEVPDKFRIGSLDELPAELRIGAPDELPIELRIGASIERPDEFRIGEPS